jgi:hypothetical protein
LPKSTVGWKGMHIGAGAFPGDPMQPPGTSDAAAGSPTQPPATSEAAVGPVSRRLLQGARIGAARLIHA